MKVIQTVTGLISPEDLGVTMMHEHTFWDMRGFRPPLPAEEDLRSFLTAPVDMNILGRIHYNMHQHLDNIHNTDSEVSTSEMFNYRHAGGDTICDVSTYGMGRNAKAVQAVAKATGLNIVLGTGLYVRESQPDFFRSMKNSELINLFVREATVGDDDGILSGIIGEIGISDPSLPSHEIELLEIAVKVQKESGLTIMIHPPFFEKAAHKILDVLEKNGANMERVIYAHIDPMCADTGYQASIINRGVCIEYDEFGMEFPCTLEHYVRRWLPSDIQRIRGIAELVARGYSSSIVLSQDICFKAMLKQYGGVGYAHILDNILPSMRDEGINDKSIMTMLCDNPRRLLSVER